MVAWIAAKKLKRHISIRSLLKILKERFSVGNVLKIIKSCRNRSKQEIRYYSGNKCKTTDENINMLIYLN